MNAWAIVPVKPLNQAKSRLSGELVPEQREVLATALLERTIRLLAPLSYIQGVLVISRDTKALSMVREWGAQTVQESGAPELNNALYRATQVMRTRGGADAALIVPADLPLLGAEDIKEMVNLGRYHNSVVIAPDRHEHGTNLLLVRPPGIIPYSFGQDSFAEHQRLAKAVSANVFIYRSMRASLDLDTPSDLVSYFALAKSLNEPTLDGITLGDWFMAEDIL
jgi:2-phospho-L-lactate guanylyltransferase